MKPIPLNDADRRALYYEPDPSALDEFRELAAETLEREIRLARLLHRIHLKNAFVGAKRSSIEDLALHYRLDPFRARDLLRLGYALAGHPLVEEWLRDGTLGFAHAFLFGDLYRAEANRNVGTENELPPVFDPDDLEDEDRWLHVMP